jgi:hypothetical protein
VANLELRTQGEAVRKVVREIALIGMAVGSVPGSILLVQYLEGHGYLEWGARLDLELVAQVIVGPLALFAVLMGFAIRKRSPRRRPGNVMLLSGYKGPKSYRKYRLRSRSQTADRSSDKEIRDRQEGRLGELRFRILGRYVLGPYVSFVIGWVMLGVLLFARAMWPGVDPNGWQFFVRAFPIIAGGWMVALYVMTNLMTWWLIRRKGARRALRFLFPEAFDEMPSWVNRVAYRAMGIGGVIERLKK